MMGEVRCICDCACELGEGIFWDRQRRRLFWFDILRRRLLSCGADGGGFAEAALARRGSAAAVGGDGDFVVAADNGWGRYNPEQNHFYDWRPIEGEPPAHRTNDGRADPHGAFWFGTMRLDGADSAAGSIYRVSPDGELKKTITGVSIPNAIAFSPDGGLMYWTDSPKRIIWRCELSPAGEPGAREVFVSLAGKPQVPDGAVVDAEGFLWCAEWDGWRVVRYDPDGGVARVVRLPVARPTCPALGGEGLDTVFVSSARNGISAAQLKGQPLAGGVFAFAVSPG